MSEHQDAAAADEAGVDEAVGAAADRIRRALQSDDAGRVAGPGARPEDHPRGKRAAPGPEDEPPAADAVAP
jgi:hypothetical protein